MRNISGKYRPPSKLSSFSTAKGAHMVEDESNFNEDDIDEKDSTAGSLAINPKIVHKSFVPKLFSGRGIPQTPGFTEKKSLSYLKSIATPMQNRRTFRLAQGAKKQPRAYLQRLAEGKPEDASDARKDPSREESKTLQISRRTLESPYCLSISIPISAPNNTPNTGPVDNPAPFPVPAPAPAPAPVRVSVPAVSPVSKPNLIPIPQLNPVLDARLEGAAAIAEISHSSGTEGQLEKFETVMSHPSPSINDSSSDQERNKETPKFGARQPQVAGADPNTQNSKACPTDHALANTAATTKVNLIRGLLKDQT